MRRWVLAAAVVVLAMVVCGVVSGAVIDNPSFEDGELYWNGWSYCDRSCTCDCGYCSDCMGGVSTGWCTEGTRSACLEIIAAPVDEGNQWCTGTAKANVYQTVDFTGVSQLKLDMHRTTDCGGDPCPDSRSTTLSVVIGSTTAWSSVTSSVSADETWTDVVIDTSGYTGTHTLYLRNYITASHAGDSPHVYASYGWFDNLRTTMGTPPPIDLTNTIGKFWVNHTWGAGAGSVSDSYNVSINGTWHNSTTNPHYNNTLTTYGDWSNITAYAYNNSNGLSSGYISEDVQLPSPIPAVPAGAGSTWDYCWVNHSWTAGSSYGTWCGDTNSYNVSINGTWHNGTTNTYYNNTGLSPHGWSNATIYAFNDTAGINETYIFQNVQMANRAITITNTSDWSGWASVNVYVDYDATDPDGDAPTFSCNRTDLFTDFSTATGKGNWTAATGTYYVDFGVSDGWGSTSNYTMTITGYSSTPPAPTNLAYSTGCHFVSHTWQAGIGVTTDSYNVSINGVWHNGTTNAYYNETGMAPIGWSNISVYAFNDSVGMTSDTNVYQNVQIPRCPSLCTFTFYDTFEWGVGLKVAGGGGWLPCDDNGYAYSPYGVNFYAVEVGHEIENIMVKGKWDPLVHDFTSCYHGIGATEDCEIIYIHADILAYSSHDRGIVYVGEPFYDYINPGNPTHEVIGFEFDPYIGYTRIWLLGVPESSSNVVLANPLEWISVSAAYDLTTKKYIYLEVIDSTTTHTRYDVSTVYTTQTRDLSNVTLRFGVDTGDLSFGGWHYVDNVYVSSLEYAPSSTYIVLKDASGNQITNAQVSIYDTSAATYTQKWENDADGVITISSGAAIEALVAVRTFDGVHTRQFSTNESGGVVNWTIPIHYNLKVYPVDEQRKPLTGVFAGLAEYTAIDPQAFWGMGWGSRGYVAVGGCSGFPMCDIIAEKEGYESYNETALNWTSKSALIKDYRHTATLIKE